MTIIAWDGKTLAADKMIDMGGYKTTVTKIVRHENELLFSSGHMDAATELFHWYKSGADPATWPEAQRDKDAWNSLGVITEIGKVIRYEKTPYPWEVEGAFFAVGSGRDYALAAMHLGFDAAQAVNTAIQLCPSCGMGVDILTLGARVG